MYTLKLGDSSVLVKQLQTILGIESDGEFGPHTLAAVEAFQKTNGLTIDGVVGPKTWSLLLKNLPKPTNYLKGLDVSHYDGLVDWVKVKAQNFAFAMVKVSEGGLVVDSQFKNNWAGAKEQGLLRSAYHFFHPSQDPTEAANNFLASLEGDFGELPCSLDWETHEGTPEQEQAAAKIWLDIVEKATGKRPIVYSYPSYFDELGNPAWLAGYLLWIASPDKTPEVPSPWSAWFIWQNSFTIVIDGVPGEAADTNLFNGTFEDLKNYKWS